MRIYTESTFQWDGKRYVEVSSQSYRYDGPVELCCGATGEQKETFAKQSALMDTMTGQLKDVFGDSSSVFKNLTSTFAPIFAAGPGQRGFSGPERAAFNTQIKEGTARDYAHAAKAVNESLAARGGNEFIPSGADDQLRQDVAESAAAHESDQQMRLTEEDYAQGRQNWVTAAGGLAGAPGVFNPAVGFGSNASTAGRDAADTANQIAQADNSWIDATIGALGGIAGSVATGGMSNLGKGVGFFGKH